MVSFQTSLALTYSNTNGDGIHNWIQYSVHELSSPTAQIIIYIKKKIILQQLTNKRKIQWNKEQWGKQK